MQQQALSIILLLTNSLVVGAQNFLLKISVSFLVE